MAFAAGDDQRGDDQAEQLVGVVLVVEQVVQSDLHVVLAGDALCRLLQIVAVPAGVDIPARLPVDALVVHGFVAPAQPELALRGEQVERRQGFGRVVPAANDVAVQVFVFRGCVVHGEYSFP